MSDGASTLRSARYLHLTPEEIWTAQASSGSYRPEAFERDGFIHCTIGEDDLIAVANAFYATDSRTQVVLVIDPNFLTAPVRFEDSARIYPHLYGPLNVEAVRAVRRVRRTEDGSYDSIDAAEIPVD